MSTVQDPPLTPRKVFLAFALYFGLHVLLRVLVSDTAELDESEQLILTQQWAWGYRSDPPLYIWLQKLVFGVVGLNIFGLAIFKNLLLFGTCWFSYQSARTLLKSETYGLLAAISLLLLPQIFWESQRDLTHTVLAATMSAAILWAGLQAWATPSFWRFTILGLCAGFGLLSKYNVAFFLGAFLLAALSLPVFRAHLLRPGLAWSLVLMLAIPMPHWLWAINHSGAAQARFSQMQVSAQAGLGRAYLNGLGTLVVAITAFLALLVGAYWLAAASPWARRVPPRSTPADEPDLASARALLHRIVWIELAFILILIFGFHTKFKDRWLQPLLFFAPILVVLHVRNRLSYVQVRWLRNGIALLAAGVLVILPAIPVAAAFTNRPTRLNAPFTALAAHLKSSGINPGVILADSRYVGGNLRLAFPDSRVAVPEFAQVPMPRNTITLIAWDATKQPDLPPALRAMLEAGQWSQRLPAPTLIEAPFKYCPRKAMKVGYIVLPKP